MKPPTRDVVRSFDGAELAVHRLGEGEPLLLLHGLFSDAQTNWIRFGHAARLAAAGRAVFMPDLRAHGRSGKPHDAAAYPPDVLARDVAAMVRHYGWDRFDLAGFSLGARTAARCVINGLLPRRLALVGMGLEGLTGWDRRAAFFLDAIDRFENVRQGDPAFMAVSFMKTMKVDRLAARLLLQSVADAEPAQLAAALTMPVLVLCGNDDRDNGSPERLAALLPDARLQFIPGTHMSSVARPEMGEELARFFG
ncbi:alpha/beta fold hydrolase [Erythrobacteraceae bacterium CFH 75059]|uniref:alpha/beta fold hydrolase n=1 Tax=Qipengyuania thermophila TaxID=2509361 RepID=UPI00101F8A05|nr:alpha/beta fold hydrolase [Qipengyuania thermophila]TCD05378.1 alpha/beta fold hydrolase [Erythrobacteraceae bacterium CFH 75059]